MRYLAESSLLLIRLFRYSMSPKKGIMSKLIKMLIIGFMFMLITWILFGESLSPTMILLFPLRILSRGASGG